MFEKRKDIVIDEVKNNRVKNVVLMAEFVCITSRSMENRTPSLSARRFPEEVKGKKKGRSTGQPENRFQSQMTAAKIWTNHLAARDFAHLIWNMTSAPERKLISSQKQH